MYREVVWILIMNLSAANMFRSSKQSLFVPGSAGADLSFLTAYIAGFGTVKTTVDTISTDPGGLSGDSRVMVAAVLQLDKPAAMKASLPSILLGDGEKHLEGSVLSAVFTVPWIVPLGASRL